MKRFTAIAILILASYATARAQTQSVAIGTTTTNSKAVLLLVGSGSQGLMIPIVTNKSAVGAGASETGMIVYDDSDQKVWYFNGNIWTVFGGGGGGSTTALLKVSGNSLSIDPTGTASIKVANTAPSTAGQILMWDGSGWTSSTSTAPTNGQVLKWNITTNKWEPGSDLTTSYGGTAPINVTGSLISLNPISDANVAAGANIAVAKLAGGAPNNGKVLTVTAGVPTWTTPAGGGSVSIVTAAAPLTVTTPTSTPNITIAKATNSQDGYLAAADWTTFNNKFGVSTSANGDLSGTYASPTVNKIQGTSVSNTPPTAGQVLQYSGSSWGPTNLGMTTTGDIIFGGASGVPTRLAGSAGFLKSTGAAAPTWSALTAADIPNLDAGKITTGILPVARGGTGVNTVPTNGQLLIGNGAGYAASSLSGDISAVTAAGAVTLRNSAATRTNLGLGALAVLATISSTEITDGAIMDIDVNSAAAISGTKINPAFGPQIVSTTGKVGIGTLTPANSLDVSNSEVIGATYAGTIAAPANSLAVEGSVGIGTPNPSSKLNVYPGSFAPGADKAVTELYHNGSGFGNAGIANSSSGGDGTGTVYAIGKMAGFESNPTGLNNFGFWGHQFAVGAGGWGVIASNGVSATSPTTYVALGGQSFALRIVDGNEAAGAVLKSDASGNATWGPAQSIAFSGYNGGGQTFAASTWTVVTIPTEEYDLSSNFSGSTFTVPGGGAGIYHFTANVNFGSPLVNGRYQIAIYVNGLNRKAVDFNTLGTQFQSMHIDCDLQLNAGDAVTAQIWISSGDTSSGSPQYVYFQGRKVN